MMIMYFLQQRIKSITPPIFNYPHSNLFWKHLEKYYFNLGKKLVLSLREIIIGITALSYPLLNYLILIGKVCIWDCRRKRVRPCIEGFILEIKTKHKIEKYIATKNNDLETFYKKLDRKISTLSRISFCFSVIVYSTFLLTSLRSCKLVEYGACTTSVNIITVV